MINLPKNYEFEKYGIQVRLVCEEDAEFIVKLRTNEKLARYIHSVDDNVSKQVEWIKEYKKREAKGLDYYFIFYKDGQPIVLNRLYDIDWIHLTYTSGSWVSVPGTDYEAVMTCSVIVLEIAFDVLGLLVDIYDVRKENSQVLHFHRKILGAYEYGETELDYLFMLTKEAWQKSRLKRLLGL